MGAHFAHSRREILPLEQRGKNSVAQFTAWSALEALSEQTGDASFVLSRDAKAAMDKTGAAREMNMLLHNIREKARSLNLRANNRGGDIFDTPGMPSVAFALEAGAPWAVLCVPLRLLACRAPCAAREDCQRPCGSSRVARGAFQSTRGPRSCPSITSC